MSDRVVSFFLTLGFMALDGWLKSRIDRQGWPAATKERARALEDELVKFLEPIVGELAKHFAPKLVGRALAKAFPNDPSTANWG